MCYSTLLRAELHADGPDGPCHYSAGKISDTPQPLLTGTELQGAREVASVLYCLETFTADSVQHHHARILMIMQVQ